MDLEDGEEELVDDTLLDAIEEEALVPLLQSKVSGIHDPTSRQHSSTQRQGARI